MLDSISTGENFIIVMKMRWFRIKSNENWFRIEAYQPMWAIFNWVIVGNLVRKKNPVHLKCWYSFFCSSSRCRVFFSLWCPTKFSIILIRPWNCPIILRMKCSGTKNVLYILFGVVHPFTNANINSANITNDSSAQLNAQAAIALRTHKKRWIVSVKLSSLSEWATKLTRYLNERCPNDNGTWNTGCKRAHQMTVANHWKNQYSRCLFSREICIVCIYERNETRERFACVWKRRSLHHSSRTYGTS